jgi:hypothetical protein
LALVCVHGDWSSKWSHTRAARKRGLEVSGSLRFFVCTRKGHFA